VAEVVDYTGKFCYATQKPDGVPQKLLDVSRLTAMGWQPRIPLRQGLANAYKWYVERVANEYSEPILKHELLSSKK
jgi:GDP-L-fucose synthase